MLDFLKDFFFEHQPTEADLHRKAEQVDFEVEETEAGYTLQGTYDNEARTWSGDFTEVNGILDHVNSVKIGDEYRRERFGLEPGELDTSEEWVEHKHEVRDYRTETYYSQEYQPGWRRLLPW